MVTLQRLPEGESSLALGPLTEQRRITAEMKEEQVTEMRNMCISFEGIF